MKKKSLSILFFALVLFVSVKTPYLFTKGFRVNKILFPRNYVVTPTHYQVHPNWKQAKEILDQPFTYLGKGRQAYVFQSADGQHVIKFMRYHKYQKPLWTYASGRFHVREQQARTFRKEQKERFQRAIDSYQIALEEIPEITGLVFTHVYPTKNILNQKIEVVDGLGLHHQIDLDQVGFLLQKKAQPLDVALKHFQKEGKVEDANALLASYLQMVSYRASKGILNRDFLNGIRNSGVIDGCPVEIDVGSFYKDAQMDDNALYSLEVGRYGEEMTSFIRKRIPECFSSLEKEIHTVLLKEDSSECIADQRDERLE